jgi:serine/threonine-protein kinase RsbW
MASIAPFGAACWRNRAESGGDVTNMAGHRSEHAARPVQAWTRAFPARPEQVGWARKFLAAAVGGCPAADDAVLVVSELAGNSVLHSASSRPGGVFTVQVEVLHGDYVRIEVRDEGGPWHERTGADGRAHGLAIVRSLAAESGIDGDALTGWIAWAKLDWAS